MMLSLVKMISRLVKPTTNAIARRGCASQEVLAGVADQL
jgi:hypothetical protein